MAFGTKKTLQDFSCKVNYSIVILQIGFAPNQYYSHYYLLAIAACAAASLAIGTRKGEQDT